MGHRILRRRLLLIAGSGLAGLPAAVAQGPRRVGILFAPAAERQAHSALPRHHPSSTLPPKIFLPLCMDLG